MLRNRLKIDVSSFVSLFRKPIDSFHKQGYVVDVDINAKKRRVDAERCVESPWMVKREVKAALKHLLEQFAEATVG